MSNNDEEAAALRVARVTQALLALVEARCKTPSERGSALTNAVVNFTVANDVSVATLRHVFDHILKALEQRQKKGEPLSLFDRVMIVAGEANVDEFVELFAQMAFWMVDNYKEIDRERVVNNIHLLFSSTEEQAEALSQESQDTGVAKQFENLFSPPKPKTHGTN